MITQTSCITQHFPSSWYWSTWCWDTPAEFRPAGAGFLHHSLAGFQSDTLNEIPKGQNWRFEVRNGATAGL